MAECTVNTNKKTVSRVSLKSSDVKDSSQIIRAILISSFGSSSCGQNKLSIDHQTNSVFVNDDFEDESLSCRIQLLHLFLAVKFDCVEKD